MKKNQSTLRLVLLVLVGLVALAQYLGVLPNSQTTDKPDAQIINTSNDQSQQAASIDRDGAYDTRDEVALYLHTYDALPPNFITKEEADKLGFDNGRTHLDKIAPGKSIGGSHFGNYDSLLPDEKGRSWKECDIDYHGGSRNAKRIVYSNDGLIYYTHDHYKTFERLY